MARTKFGGEQIQDNDITSSQIGTDAVRSDEIKDNTIAFVDLSSTLVLNEMDFATASATALATQSSIKTYVDSNSITEYTAEIGGAQEAEIDVTSSLADSLGGTYWTIGDGSGRDYYVWYDTGSSSDPNVANHSSVQVNLGATSIAANTVATKTASMLALQTGFTSTSSGSVVTVTNDKAGACSQPVDNDAGVLVNLLADGTGSQDNDKIWDGDAGDYSYTITSATHGVTIDEYNVNIVCYESSVSVRNKTSPANISIEADDDIVIENPTNQALYVFIR